MLGKQSMEQRILGEFQYSVDKAEQNLGSVSEFAFCTYHALQFVAFHLQHVCSALADQEETCRSSDQRALGSGAALTLPGLHEIFNCKTTKTNSKCF